MHALFSNEIFSQWLWTMNDDDGFITDDDDDELLIAAFDQFQSE